MVPRRDDAEPFLFRNIKKDFFLTNSKRYVAKNL